MSEILIEIKSGKDQMQTPEVWVDGKFAYRTGTPKSVEAVNIEKLLFLMNAENYRVEVK